MAVEETDHQNHQDGHEHGDYADQGHVGSLLLIVIGQILKGGMNDHLGEARGRFGVTSLADGKGLLFVFEGAAMMGTVAVGAEGCIFVSQIDRGFAVIVVQVGGGLGRVAPTADRNRSSPV